MIAATQVGRTLGAVVPLIILAVAAAIVVVMVMVVPTRERRESGTELLRELTKFARAVVG